MDGASWDDPAEGAAAEQGGTDVDGEDEFMQYPTGQQRPVGGTQHSIGADVSVSRSCVNTRRIIVIS